MAKSTQQDAATYTGAGKDVTAIARTLIDAYNTRDFDRLDAILAPDAEVRNVATGEVYRGADAMKRYQRNWATAFPESKVEIATLVGCGETVTMEYVGRGRQTGPLDTPQGRIEPTGRSVELPLCDVLTVRNGRITGGRTYYDVATLLRQLGR